VRLPRQDSVADIAPSVIFNQIMNVIVAIVFVCILAQPYCVPFTDVESENQQNLGSVHRWVQSAIRPKTIKTHEQGFGDRPNVPAETFSRAGRLDSQLRLAEGKGLAGGPEVTPFIKK